MNVPYKGRSLPRCSPVASQMLRAAKSKRQTCDFELKEARMTATPCELSKVPAVDLGFASQEKEYQRNHLSSS